MDENLSRHMKISPQLLEIVADDPDALVKLNRVQRALIADKATRKILDDPDATPAQMASVLEALRKGEQHSPGAGSAAGGFFFQITLPNSGQTYGVDTRPPIEHDPTDV